MRYIDVTGKTEEEAVRKALEQLHLDRDDVSVEILERAKSGFLGFDGRVINGHWGEELKRIADEKHGSLSVDEDLINLIWKDRPAMSCEKAWMLDEQYSGRSTAEKMAAVRAEMDTKQRYYFTGSCCCQKCKKLRRLCHIQI